MQLGTLRIEFFTPREELTPGQKQTLAALQSSPDCKNLLEFAVAQGFRSILPLKSRLIHLLQKGAIQITQSPNAHERTLHAN